MLERLKQVLRVIGYFIALAFKGGIVVAIAGGVMLLVIANFAPPGQTNLIAAVPSHWNYAAVIVIVVAVSLRLAISRFSRGLARWTYRKLRDGDLPQGDDTPSLRFVIFANRTYAARYPDEAIISHLVAALVAPSGLYDRIKEDIEVAATRYIRTTVLSLRVAEESLNLVPILAQPKGSLIDDLDVQVDGSSASTLSYIENQGAMAVVVDTLFTEVHAAVVDSDVLDAALLTEILLKVCAPTSQDVRRELDLLDSVRSRIPSAKLRQFLALRRVVELCAKNYFIFAVVESKKHQTRIKVRISASENRGPGRQWVRDSVRIALGMRQRDHVFSLPRALETVSYHLSMLTPRGMYVYDKQFGRVAVASPTSLPTARTRLTFPASQSSSSTKFLHVYLRDIVGRVGEATLPSVRVELRERPPGLLEISLGLSLFLGLITWTVAVYHDQVFGADGVSGTWPTVLFGIPTLLVGWLIARIDGSALAKVSFTSVAMVAWLAINSVIAVVVAALKSSGANVTSRGGDYFGVYLEHPVWTALVISCGAHCVFTFVLSISRALRYALALNGLTSFMERNTL